MSSRTLCAACTRCSGLVGLANVHARAEVPVRHLAVVLRDSEEEGALLPEERGILG